MAGTRRLAAAATAMVVAALVSCRGGETSAPKPADNTPSARWRTNAPGPAPVLTSDNLLDLTRGAVVTWRTGEFAFEQSALYAIDSDLSTLWGSPPGDPVQSLIVRLPATTELTKVGARFQSDPIPAGGTNRFRFESSLDGVAFQPLAEVRLQPRPPGQLFDVKPVEARFLRVTMLGTFNGRDVTAVPQLEAEGREREPWAAPDVTGSWTLNQYGARLTQAGGAVSGVVAMDPPMMIDGGWSGRSLRFVWTRGKTFGYGILSVTPDGKALSGIWWFEKAIPEFLGEPWFGERTSAESLPFHWKALEQWMARFGSVPLYGIAFTGDDAVDEPASRASVGLLSRMIAINPAAKVSVETYEFHAGSPAANHARAEKQAASLRALLAREGVDLRNVTFVAKGSDDPRAQVANPLQVTLASRVDLRLEFPPARR